ncbi:Neurolysin, mitochondrial, partial [Stegodyphus mimosarum]
MPPHKGMRFSWDMKMQPEDLIKRADELINKCRKVYDHVGTVPDNDVSYESILKVLGEIECEYTSERYMWDFPQSVSTDQAIRDASTEADHRLQAFDVEISMRQDVFNKLLILEKKQELMKPEAKRFLERLIKLGKRNGLHLSDEIQKEIKTIKGRMNDLCIQFNKNLSEEATILEFTEEELDGLPLDFILSLNQNPDTGKNEVTLKYPHYFPIMRKCKNPETRRLMELAFNSQCINENIPILEE